MTEDFNKHKGNVAWYNDKIVRELVCVLIISMWWLFLCPHDSWTFTIYFVLYNTVISSINLYSVCDHSSAFLTVIMCDIAFSTHCMRYYKV